MERVNAVIYRLQINEVLRKHDSIGRSKGGGDACPPLVPVQEIQGALSGYGGFDISYLSLVNSGLTRTGGDQEKAQREPSFPPWRNQGPFPFHFSRGVQKIMPMRNAITRPAWSGLLILCLLFLPMACRSVPDAGISLGEQERILAAAEKPFVLMGQKDFRTLWGSISQRSRVAILNDVLKACRSLHGECDRNELQADFAKGGPSAMIYWELPCRLRPEHGAPGARWSMGNVSADEAEVPRPAQGIAKGGDPSDHEGKRRVEDGPR